MYWWKQKYGFIVLWLFLRDLFKYHYFLADECKNKNIDDDQKVIAFQNINQHVKA